MKIYTEKELIDILSNQPGIDTYEAWDQLYDKSLKELCELIRGKDFMLPPGFSFSEVDRTHLHAEIAEVLKIDPQLMEIIYYAHNVRPNPEDTLKDLSEMLFIDDSGMSVENDVYKSIKPYISKIAESYITSQKDIKKVITEHYVALVRVL